MLGPLSWKLLKKRDSVWLIAWSASSERCNLVGDLACKAASAQHVRIGRAARSGDRRRGRERGLEAVMRSPCLCGRIREIDTARILQLRL